jgi:hypothetical protein
MREFKIGDQVLLFNSHFKYFAGKLKFEWEGPLVIQDIYRSRAIRLQRYLRGKPNVVMDNILNIILQVKSSL